MNEYSYLVEAVAGGYDLVISHGEASATLLIHDEKQAPQLAQQLIDIAIKDKITINEAFCIFNRGAAMYANELMPKL